jgi:ParB/RepB/Spo0J family partition protein
MAKETTTVDNTVTKTVPLSKIDPNAFANCRQYLDTTKVENLKASIATQGLLTPLTVTNGGDTYTLISGFNRYAALKALGYKEVRVEVREFDDPMAPFIDNLAENIARSDPHPADVSRRIGAIVSGAILRKSEEDPLEDPKVDKKELARKIGLSTQHFTNLLRADQNCPDEVKAAWRKFDVPIGKIFEWMKEPAEVQAENLATWIEEREELIASGRKKKVRKDKGSKKGGKKETAEERSDRLTVQELRVALGKCHDKRDKGGVKGADLAYLEGKIRGLELALGDITEAAFTRGY